VDSPIMWLVAPEFIIQVWLELTLRRAKLPSLHYRGRMILRILSSLSSCSVMSENWIEEDCYSWSKLLAQNAQPIMILPCASSLLNFDQFILFTKKIETTSFKLAVLCEQFWCKNNTCKWATPVVWTLFTKWTIYVLK
jgi:hypothetical protein